MRASIVYFFAEKRIIQLILIWRAKQKQHPQVLENGSNVVIECLKANA